MKFVGSILVPVGMLKRMVKPLKTQNALIVEYMITHGLLQAMKYRRQTPRPLGQTTTTARCT